MHSVLPETLFDEFGRCIPSNCKSPAHQRIRRYFTCEQPVIDYAKSLNRLRQHLGVGETIDAKSFAGRIQTLIHLLQETPSTAAITLGVAVPFILPKLQINDIGTELEQRFLPAVKNAFQEKFPEHLFTNHHKASLAQRLNVQQGSRHERLIAEMRQREVIGLYFPCLLAYSIPAAIEQLSALPETFMLAGGFDTAAALVSSPELLYRKQAYPPLLWLGALGDEKEGIAYHFEAYGYNLTFNRRAHLGQAAEYWACGLSVLAT